MTERALLEEIHRKYRPAKLFRNDNGAAWVARRAVKLRNGDVILKGGRRIKYGLMPGSGDLIGWTPTEITPEMVGKTIAVFTSIEAKTANDRLDDAGIQEAWLRNVRAAGGRALVVRELLGEIFEEDI